jgi:hypothetical protein
LTESLDAAALFRRLHDAEVRYVVVGGFAVIAHGFQRFTKDLDVCPDPAPDNLMRLASMLADLGARHAGLGDFGPEEFPFDPTDPGQLAEGGNFRLETPLGDLDVMQWIPGVPGDLAYDHLVRGALTAPVHGIPVAVCSLRDLLEMKRIADRPQDRIDLERLAVAQGDA